MSRYACEECGAGFDANEYESALAGESAALQRVAELEARVAAVRELRDGAVDGRFHEAMRLVLRILEGGKP